MSIFKHLDYRVALKAAFSDQKKLRKNLTLEKLAAQCNIQKTYLSKVLNHGGNLTADQIYLACEYLNLNESEKHFLNLLLSYDQCYVDKRKKNLLKQIHEIQKKEQSSESHLKVKTQEISHESLYEYYSDPLHQVIHIFLTIPEFQNNIDRIAKCLGLESLKFNFYLNNLAKMNIIKQTDHRYESIIDNLHLPANSSLIKAYRTLTRIQTLERLNTINEQNAYNFTVVFSTDKLTKEKIHKNFLQFLKDTQTLVEKGKEEEVYQMNFDLFKWS